LRGLREQGDAAGSEKVLFQRMHRHWGRLPRLPSCASFGLLGRPTRWLLASLRARGSPYVEAAPLSYLTLMKLHTGEAAPGHTALPRLPLAQRVSERRPVSHGHWRIGGGERMRRNVRSDSLPLFSILRSGNCWSVYSSTLSPFSICGARLLETALAAVA
jgi:hypothetical protein